MAKFEFDERALKRLVDQGVNKVAREYERMFARLTAQYQGRPIEEIKPVLRSEWRKVADGDITDPELTEMAEAISNGTTVRFNVKS